MASPAISGPGVLHTGAEAEYERRHRPIWKDLEDVLLDHGVGTYSIFLDEASHELFGYVEVDSDERWARVAGTEVCQRWWRYMRDVMPSNEDHSPVSRDLREVFHIEGTSGSREAGETPVAAPKGTR